MSALAEALGRAAEILPGRVKWVGTHTAQVVYQGEVRSFALAADSDSLVWLEAACREECKTRKWSIQTYIQWTEPRKGDPGYWTYTGQVYVPSPKWGIDDKEFWSSGAPDSPGLALLLALLAAAEAGGKE